MMESTTGCEHESGHHEPDCKCNELSSIPEDEMLETVCRIEELLEYYCRLNQKMSVIKLHRALYKSTLRQAIDYYEKNKGR